MRISRRNLSLLIESLLTENLNREEVAKTVPKKIRKMVTSILYKATHPARLDGSEYAIFDEVLTAMEDQYMSKTGKRYEDIDYDDADWKEEVGKIADIISKTFSGSFPYSTAYMPHDVIGVGETDQDIEKNRGVILNWVLNRAKQDVAQYSAKELAQLHDKYTYTVQNSYELRSPLTPRLLDVFDTLGYMLYDNKNKYIDPLTPRMSKIDQIGQWPAEIEHYFLYRHLFPPELRNLNAFESYKKLSDYLYSMEEVISEYKAKAAKKHLDNAIEGAKFLRGSWSRDGGQLKPNPKTGYYTQPDGEGVVVAQIMNEPAAIAFCRDRPGAHPKGGEHCRLCTGATVDADYYEMYSRAGPLFYVEVDGERYQIHFASGQYRDVHDAQTRGPVRETVVMTLVRELAKEFGNLDDFDEDYVSPVGKILANQHPLRPDKGQVYGPSLEELLDNYGFMGPPQY